MSEPEVPFSASIGGARLSDALLPTRGALLPEASTPGVPFSVYAFTTGAPPTPRSRPLHQRHPPPSTTGCPPCQKAFVPGLPSPFQDAIIHTRSALFSNGGAFLFPRTYSSQHQGAPFSQETFTPGLTPVHIRAPSFSPEAHSSATEAPLSA